MRIEAGLCTLRALALQDAEAMTRMANDPEIAANLRDLFPHPYGRDDAIAFITTSLLDEPRLNWAIEAGGRLAGVIGGRPGVDVYARSVEIGYWLGREFWGRGIATAAVRAFCRHLLAVPGIERLSAGVFSGNDPSARVLEKAGFRREGTLRRHVVKNGVVRDEWVYGMIREDLE